MRAIDMHALGRIGTTAEIAEAFEYLVRAEWTTGNVLTVDGGLGLGVTNAYQGCSPAAALTR